MTWSIGIRGRFFLALASLALALLLAVGLGSAPLVQSALERELDQRLQAVGGSAIELLDPALAPGLVALGPGQAGSRLHREKQAVLVELCARTGVRRLFLADTTGRSIVDSDPRVGIGAALPQLRADRNALVRVRAGDAVSGPLFRDESGSVRKTGYVPLMSGGRAIGLVGAEADASFLFAVSDLRRRLLWVGASSLVFAFLLAAIAARGLTRPLDRLVEWGRGFGRGDLETPPPTTGRDEIGFLAATLEQARLELSARDREQRAMVAGIAHEIRNPLGGIRLYVELLGADPTVSTTAQARLGKILRELDHLGAVVDEFLRYARPGSPQIEPVPLARVVTEVTELLAGEARARSITFAVDIDPALTAPLDPVHARQMFMNLLRNAVEASPDSGRVTVEGQESAREIGVAVEDQGQGIPVEVRDRLFEPFFTTKPQGSGLGLAIVRRLALGHRGRVEVGTGRDGGARFVVVVPRLRP